MIHDRLIAMEPVLKEIGSKLEHTSIVWAVTGSTGMALQGMPVIPSDLDLQTDRDGAYALASLFSDRIVRPVTFSSTERICSHFGAFEILGVQVEIMGDVSKRMPDGKWEDPVDVKQVRRWVNWRGMRLPVMDLAHEAEAYRRLGRTEKAERIRKWLEGKTARQNE
ncbi:nucleotidyltransferase domain-containing protein [Staphylospora marina]|uniref:nucleotidyltransferase domain-containing protein n=1 Tax=Staphylospora marina TaxID=2490858 RepID=UPI0019CFD2F2|nr:hypothetical protein [Staphylospora marina]